MMTGNYIEVEINPLGTVMDLTLTKAFKDGGSANLEWKFEGIKVGIGVDGTLNDKSDKDAKAQRNYLIVYKSNTVNAL